ncbi:hypothetical protein RI367_004669 [Sorochytrium milnesiophthora]
MWGVEITHEMSSFIGIAAALAGNVAISVALNVQKYAHIKLSRRAAEASGGRSSNAPRQQSAHRRTPSQASRYGAIEPPGSTPQRPTSGATLESQMPLLSDTEAQTPPGYVYWREPTWWIGMILMIAGETGNFMAYGFAPASVIAPLGTVALIANAIIAPLALGERFRRQDLLGVLLAIVGAVVVVSSAKQTETQFDPNGLVDLFLQTQFLVYVLCTVLIGLFLVSASNQWGRHIIVVDLGLVAIFGSYTVLSTKALATLLGLTFVRMFTFPITYLMVAVMISTGVLQIRYLNHALAHFDSTAVIPTQFVLFTISVIIGSAILYRDFEDMSSHNIIVFCFGCILTFIGVFFITSDRAKAPLSAASTNAVSASQYTFNVETPDVASSRASIASSLGHYPFPAHLQQQPRTPPAHQQSARIPSTRHHLPSVTTTGADSPRARRISTGALFTSTTGRNSPSLTSSAYFHPYSASIRSALYHDDESRAATPYPTDADDNADPQHCSSECTNPETSASAWALTSADMAGATPYDPALSTSLPTFFPVQHSPTPKSVKRRPSVFGAVPAPLSTPTASAAAVTAAAAPAVNPDDGSLPDAPAPSTTTTALAAYIPSPLRQTVSPSPSPPKLQSLPSDHS